MRVLVVSDTHRHNENYLEVVRREAPVDMVIHCGDVEGSEYLICEDAECETYIVLGNNDFFSNLPREIELEMEGIKTFITHGHNYYVSMGEDMIVQEAMARECNLVIYGHTHKPVINEYGHMTTMNPGSLSYPRQEGKRPSYIVMEIFEGKIKARIKYL